MNMRKKSEQKRKAKEEKNREQQSGKAVFDVFDGGTTKTPEMQKKRNSEGWSLKCLMGSLSLGSVGVSVSCSVCSFVTSQQRSPQRFSTPFQEINGRRYRTIKTFRALFCKTIPKNVCCTVRSTPSLLHSGIGEINIHLKNRVRILKNNLNE